MVRMDGSYPEFLTDILDFGPNCSTFEFGPHTFELVLRRFKVSLFSDLSRFQGTPLSDVW